MWTGPSLQGVLQRFDQIAQLCARIYQEKASGARPDRRNVSEDAVRPSAQGPCAGGAFNRHEIGDLILLQERFPKTRSSAVRPLNSRREPVWCPPRGPQRRSSEIIVLHEPANCDRSSPAQFAKSPSALGAARSLRRGRRARRGG